VSGATPSTQGHVDDEDRRSSVDRQLWLIATQDMVTGLETVTEYGRNDFIAIPARVPHLFEFVEDNYMIEW
jgi:hypothetical protein